jgi:hypothetical protein
VANKGKVEFNYNRAVLININDTIAMSVAQVFEADIKPMAQELSPVDLGTNRRSITTETQRTPDGSVMAEIFTQSGYGGYLELGHRVHIGPRGSAQGEADPADFVQGRPYIYPAFNANQSKLLEACKQNLAGLASGNTKARIF